MKHLRFKVDGHEIVIPSSMVMLSKENDNHLMNIKNIEDFRLTPEQYDVMRMLLEDTEVPFELSEDMVSKAKP